MYKHLNSVRSMHTREEKDDMLSARRACEEACEALRLEVKGVPDVLAAHLLRSHLSSVCEAQLLKEAQIATINAINLCEDMKVEEELLRGIEGTCTATESEQATPSPEVRPPHTGAERELMRAIEQGTESEQLTPSPEARLPFTAGGSSTMTEAGTTSRMDSAFNSLAGLDNEGRQQLWESARELTGAPAPPPPNQQKSGGKAVRKTAATPLWKRFTCFTACSLSGSPAKQQQGSFPPIIEEEEESQTPPAAVKVTPKREDQAAYASDEPYDELCKSLCDSLCQMQKQLHDLSHALPPFKESNKKAAKLTNSLAAAMLQEQLLAALRQCITAATFSSAAICAYTTNSEAPLLNQPTPTSLEGSADPRHPCTADAGGQQAMGPMFTKIFGPLLQPQ